MEEVKNCKIIFSNGQPDYEFFSRDLDRALKWASDIKAPINRIETPWGILNIWSKEEYEKISGML